MALLDWFVIGVVVLSMLVGAWRGLVYEVLAIAGWVAAFWLAGSWSAQAGQWLPLSGWQPAWQQAAGFLVVFVVVIFACSLLAWLAGRMMAVAGLRPADRSLGAVFGLARAAVLLLALTWGVSLTPWREAPWWQASATAPWLEFAAQGLPTEWTQDLPRLTMPNLPALPSAEAMTAENLPALPGLAGGQGQTVSVPARPAIESYGAR